MSTAAAPITVEAVMTSIVALTTALNRVADNQDRLIAGQAAAIEKIEGAKPARTPRAAKKDDAAAAEEKAPESFLPTLADVDAFKTWVGEWTGAVEGADRQARVDFLKAVAAHFGGAGFSGAFAGGQKAFFFIARARAVGADKVDFKVEYDFDGNPAQEVAAAATSDDDFG